MNKSIISFAKSVFAGITFIAMSAAVQAAPISYTDVHTYTLSRVLVPILNPTISLQPNFLSSDWKNEDGTTTSYNPDTDTLSSLNLTLNFKKLGFNPSFNASFGDLSLTQNSWTATSASFTGISLEDNGYSLGSDIELTLTSWFSKAYLTGYTLTFSGTRDLAEAVAVPTPSSLALLSAGLLGAGWFSRRRTKLANS